MLFVAEGVARGRLFEADDRADVARIDHRDLFAVVGVHLQKTADALLFLLGAVVDVRTRFQNARIGAEEGELTDEGVGSDLEREPCERLVVVRLPLLLCTRVGVDALDVVDVERGREIVDDRVQQELNALVFIAGTAKDGGDRHGDGRLPEPLFEVFDAEVAVLEILLHQFVVLFGDGFHELGAVFFRFLHHFGGDVRLLEVFAEVVFIDLRVHVDEVDDAAERILFADGELDADGARAEALAHHFDGVVEIRAVDIHFVDVSDAGNFILVRLAPDRLRLRLDAALRAESRHRAVEDAQRTLHFDGEVDVARRVDDVDPVAFPGAGRGGGRDRDPALLFLDHPVHRRGALVHFAEFVRLAGIEQNALGRRGLAGVDVRHDPDISRYVKSELSGHIPYSLN